MTKLIQKPEQVSEDHFLLKFNMPGKNSIPGQFINIEVDKQLRARGLDDIHQVYNSHDEINFELREKDVDILKEIIYNSIRECNKYFNFHVPMDMDIKVGGDWSLIH